MPARRARRDNLLARLRGSVTLSAGGLVWEIADVSAEDMVRVSQAALEGMRNLQAAYPELVEERGAYHAHGYEMGEELDEGAEVQRAPRPPVRRIGF
jgi:hypothetical protein